MSENIFNNILIIGLGLIGGSFSKSLKQNYASCKIFAYDLDDLSLKQAKEQAVIDGDFSLENSVANFDLIIIATPLSAYKEILEKIANTVSKETIIIDLGSLKNFITKILPRNLTENFVACHPIAGSEESGFEASKSELFLDKKFIICSKSANANKINDLAIKIGSKPCFIDAKEHDKIYSLISHLPQFISFLTKEFSPPDIKDDFFKQAFRLDNSAPEIWEDIFKINQVNLEKFYITFFENLADLMEDLNQVKKDNISTILKIETKSSSNPEFDEDFFIKNFPAILFRTLAVASYLKIPEIKDYQSFAGQGFRDFVSITKILNYDPIKLSDLLQKNYHKIIKIFNSIS